MRVLLADFPEKWSNPLPITQAAVSCYPIYEVAYAIFREIAMIIQYAIVMSSILLRRCCYLPSAIPRKYVKISSWNIGNLRVLRKCLVSVWHPFPKEEFSSIGRAEGLRLTHAISYHPANGLCLGMSLIFLAQYLLTKNTTNVEAFLAVAKVFRYGGTEASIRIQAIYDALMGLQGHVQNKEKKLFYHLLKGVPVFPQECQQQELLASLEAFLSLGDRLKVLRQFAFDDLENKNIEITPNIYALTLELDAAWNLPAQQYASLHYAIIHSLAKELQLELTNQTYMQGRIADVQEQLMKLTFGQYFIQFSNHTIVLVKVNEQLMALWDPSEGLALLSADEQREALSQVLHYYGNANSIELKVLAVYRKEFKN